MGVHLVLLNTAYFKQNLLSLCKLQQFLGLLYFQWPMSLWFGGGVVYQHPAFEGELCFFFAYICS
jgi:hypothetical protein